MLIQAIMRLLIVEDDPNMARFLQKGLQEERYAVDVATALSIENE